MAVVRVAVPAAEGGGGAGNVVARLSSRIPPPSHTPVGQHLHSEPRRDSTREGVREGEVVIMAIIRVSDAVWKAMKSVEGWFALPDRADLHFRTQPRPLSEEEAKQRMFDDLYPPKDKT